MGTGHLRVSGCVQIKCYVVRSLWRVPPSSKELAGGLGVRTCAGKEADGGKLREGIRVVLRVLQCVIITLQCRNCCGLPGPSDAGEQWQPHQEPPQALGRGPRKLQHRASLSAHVG